MGNALINKCGQVKVNNGTVHERRDEGNGAYRLKGWNSEAVRWLSIYMGNGRNPFLLDVETSLRALNVHIIALHEKRDDGLGFVMIKLGAKRQTVIIKNNHMPLKRQ